MGRLEYLTPETAGPGARETLASVPRLNVISLMAHADGAFVPWLKFAGSLLNTLELDPVLRELAILRVAALSPGAEYEWDQHEEIARQLGVTEAQIEGARTGEGLEGDDALVVQFTGEVVAGVAPSDETYERAAQRLSPRELIELLMVIGQYMMVARVMATAKIDPDPPVGSGLIEALR